MPEPNRTVKPNQAIQFFMPLSAARAATEEEGGGAWIHIMPIGSWKAPWQFMGLEIYEITSEAISQLVRNFDANVIGIEIAVDENHQRGPAPGWIKAVRAEADGLWARVEWTALGDDLVGKKLYAYVSPSWYDAAILPYQDPATGEQIPWVLEGLALTNKPFFSELAAVAESRQDGTLVCTAANFNAPGDSPMPEPTAPPKGGQQDPPAPTSGEREKQLEAQLAAEREETKRLKAEAAQQQHAADLKAVTERFGAVKTKDGQLAPAHAAKLAAAAMEIPADKREAHVTATIEAMTQGFVPEGEVGGTSPNRSGEVNQSLFVAARQLRIDPVHVYLADVRGKGGLIDIEGARAAVGRMGPIRASVEMPSLDYQDTMTLIRSLFLAGWEGAEPLISSFANEVTDSARTISYNALGAPPRMREWLDEIQGAVLNSAGPFAKEVQDWEATLEIPLSEYRADKLGQYAMRIQQMGAYARRHPDTLLLTLAAAAGSTLCYDGQYLCDTDHSEGDSGSQSNKLTTGYDDDEIADVSAALDLNVAAMQKFVDDRGENLDIGWQNDTVYDILCRPEARATFNTLASANEISGTTNGWKGRLRVHSSAKFTAADRFWFCYLGAPAKPFIVQYQMGGEPSALKELGPDSEHCKKTGNIWVSTQGHYTVIPGDWRYLIENNKS